MFSLTSLKCFAAAAEELNFTRATKRLFISQQALSSHISKLEEYYGVRLFDRGIPMTLTDAGRALQKHAREILSSVDDYAREVQDIKNFRQGELTVGIPVTRGTIMLPPLLSAFHQLFPQIRLHLVEGTVSGNIADALYDGTADLCIGYQPENTEELAVTPLFEEKFVVLVPDRLMKEHHLDRKLGEGALSMDRFAELPFVVQHPETMNGRVFQTLCRNAGIEPEVVVSTQNLITEASLCMEGMGACVLPLTFLSPDQRLSGHGSTPLFSQEGLDRLSIFLLDTSGIGRFQISVCRLKSKLLTRAGREFISLAREIYSGVSAGQIPPQFHFESSR